MRPTSVAVFGASAREGSVGRVVMDNIVNGGFEGSIWPVNPRHPEVEGRRCYRNAADLPGIPDLGVIVTPPETVPGIIRDLSRKGNAGSRRHHRRDHPRERPSSGDARRRQAEPLPRHRAEHARPDDPADRAQRRLRPHGRPAGQHCAAVAVGCDRHRADRLGGRERRRLFADRVARRHGRRRCRRLPRHAGGRREDVCDPPLSRNHPEPAQVHVGCPRRGAHQAGHRRQVRAPRSGGPGGRDAYRRPVGRRPGRRGGAATSRHPARQGARRAARCRGDDREIRAAGPCAGGDRHQRRRSRSPGDRPARRLRGRTGAAFPSHD